MNLKNKGELEYKSWSDFVYGASLRQPQVDAVISRLKKKDKVGVRFKLLFLTIKTDY